MNRGTEASYGGTDLQRSMELAAEHFAEDPDWQKEAWSRMDPTGLI